MITKCTAPLKRSRNKEIYIVTIILILCIVFVFIGKNFINFKDLFSPALIVSTNLNNNVKSFFLNMKDSKTLKEENEKLKKEIKQFEFELQFFEELQAENKRLSKLLNLVNNTQLQKITSKVISRSPDNWHRQFIIAAGSKNNIKVNTPIINHSGLIGKVISVTPGTSTVQLVSDPKSAVSCINQRSRSIGVIVGNYKNQAKLQYLQQYTNIKIGDVLVTSGLGGVFPKGILVGEVIEINRKPGQPIPDVEVSFVADLNHLEEIVALVK